MQDDALDTCSLCNSTIPPNAPAGQCPQCLLGFASETAVSPGDATFLSPTQLRHFGDYELEGEIARGGMGIVYRARQISLNRTVAIKMILAGQLATPESVARFRIEAEAAAALDHPNIIPVYEIGEHETQHYFSMKLIENARPISHWAGSLPRNSEGDKAIAAMLEKVAYAIAYSHARGVLHRDLKPYNILIDEDDEPLVTDFGLAKFLGETATNLTITTTILGSPAYMAPEQASGEGEPTTSSDIYGLGAILYELLCDQPPFEGKSTLAILAKLQEQPPKKLRFRRAKISPDLENICLKCLEKKPSQRYATARALAADLAHYQRGEPVAARPLSAASTLWHWCQRRPAIASLSAACLIALATGAAGIISQRNRAESANISLEKTVDILEWNLIDAALQRGERGQAIAHLAASLRTDPKHWQAAMFATSILDQHAFPLLADPASPINECSAVNSDATLLATGNAEGSIQITSLPSGEAHSTPIQAGSKATTLTFSPDSTRIAFLAGGATSIANFTDNSTLPLAAASELKVSASGETLITLSGTTLTSWSWEGTAIATITLPEAHRNWELDDAATTALTWTTNRLESWSLRTGNRLTSLDSQSPIRFAGISGDGSRCIFTDKSRHYETFDSTSGKTIGRYPHQSTGLQHIALDAAGSRALLPSHDGTIRVNDVATGRFIASILSHDYHYSSLSFSAKRDKIAVAGSQRRTRLWSLTDFTMLGEPIFTATDTPKIALTPDGSHLLVSEKNNATLWKYSRKGAARK